MNSNLAVDYSEITRKQALSNLLLGKIYTQAEIDKQIKDIREHVGKDNYMPLRACLFGRVSSKHEEQESSLFNQRDIFYPYCKAHNIVIVEEIYDQATGTALVKRPKMQYAISKCKADYFDIIIFKDDKRFTRNVVDMIKILEGLKKEDKGVRLIHNGFDSLNMTCNDLMSLSIQGVIAENYSISLHENLIKSMRSMMERDCGRAPSRMFGYKKPLDVNRRVIGSEYCEIDNERATLVLELFNRLKNLEGYASIVRDWNNREIKTLAGKPITVDFLKRMSKRKTYAGILEMGKTVTKYNHDKGFYREKVAEEHWIKRERPDLRIVPLDLFNEVQDILNSRRESYLKRQKVDTTLKNRPLSGVIKCASCGTSYKRVVGGGKRSYNYFICAKHKDKTKNYDNVHCDNNSSIREDEIMYVLKQYFVQLLDNKDNIKELVRNKVNYIIEKSKKGVKNNVDELMVQQASEKFERAKQLFIMNDINIDLYNKFKDEYEQLKREYEQNKAGVQIHFDVDDIVEKFCENLDASIDVESLDTQGGLKFNQLFDSIIAYENRTLAVNFKFIYDSPLGGINSGGCGYDCEGYHGEYDGQHGKYRPYRKIRGIESDDCSAFVRHVCYTERY